MARSIPRDVPTDGPDDAPSRAADVLDRIPPLATTGVGSLPFEDPVAAVRHVRGAYDLPFCPQLPVRDGDMVDEWLGSDPLRCGWSAERDRERPAAWDAFVAEVRRTPPVSGVAKLQVTGPVTLAVALERAAGRAGSGSDVVTLAREVAGWLAGNVTAQVERLDGIGLDAVLVVDEPGLAHAGITPAGARAWDPLRRVAPAWGLHVCSAVPWATVAAAEPDVLSFDVTRYPLDEVAARVLAAHVRRGGRIAWGVLDPVRVDGVDALAARASVAVGRVVAAGVGLHAVRRQSWLTPSCGSGRLSPRRERLVAATLGAAVDAVAGAIAADPRGGDADEA